MGTMCENALIPDYCFVEGECPDLSKYEKFNSKKSVPHDALRYAPKLIEVDKVIKIICDAPDKVNAISEILENAKYY